MRATIKDIAAETGFSVTTISLVLNGKGYKISDETKNQILAKARELNYKKNQIFGVLPQKSTSANRKHNFTKKLITVNIILDS